MHLLRRFLSSALAASLVTMPLYAVPKPPDKGGNGDHGNEIRHVLLISVDGLHALDLSNYVTSHPTSTLATLSSHGITYTNASTSATIRLISRSRVACDRWFAGYRRALV